MNWNQITEFTGPLLKPFEPDRLLWHYTDTQGLEGIIRNRTIRLSHPGFLNDPSELQYANSVYDEMLDRLASGQDGLAQKLVSGYQDYRKDNDFHVPFVASFCRDYDNLELWRQYGDDGRGFSLGFRMEELRKVVARQAHQMDIPGGIYVYRVLYHRDEQDNLTDKILRFCLCEFQKIHEAGENSNVVIHEVYTPLHTALDFFTPFFKHPCYANEQENRLVLQGYRTDLRKTKFLARRGYFKPYIDLKIEQDGTFPLDTIVVGPATPKPRCERSLQMFLNNHGLGRAIHIEIERSALPYLGSDKGSS